MHNTQLYIENTLVELDSTVHFAINKEFEETTNPTVIINDWSKSIEIPGTQSNNQLFGHIYNPDMQIVNSSVSTSYINFDPTKKLDMRLVYDGQLLMSGYAKIIEIKHKKGKIYYNCTLNGVMGKLFQEISKIRFKNVYDSSTTEDIEYTIDTSVFFTEIMDCSHMNNLWMNGQTVNNVYTLSGTLNPALTSYDIIGFAPNNSFSDDFDYKTYQPNANRSETFTERLEIHQPSLTNQIPGDTIYPDGLMPREIGEYRTYNQLPYIYFNKLFQIVCQKAYQLTGYKFILDSTWFRQQNPYWFKVAMMLQPLQYHNDMLKDDAQTNLYNSIANQVSYNAGDYSGQRTSQNFAQQSFGYSEPVPMANWTQSLPVRAYTFNIVSDNMLVNHIVDMWFMIYNQNSGDDLRFDPYGGVEFIFEHRDANNVVRDTVSVLLCGETTQLNTAAYDQVIQMDKIVWDGGTHQYKFHFTINDVFTANSQYDQTFDIYEKVQWVMQNGITSPLVDEDGDPWFSSHPIYFQGTGPMTVRMGKEIRSGSQYQLSDLWNYEYKPWDIILNYCKMFRIMINIDETKHALHFILQTKYMRNYEIEDWSNKVDMNNDFIIKPIYWGAQNILFNVEDVDTKVAKIYRDKFGLNYGDKKIVTDYKFDSNTTELFKGVKTALVTTDNVLSWDSVYTNGAISYTRPSHEISLHCKDDDSKMVNPFGMFVFHTGNAMWDSPNGNLRYVCLTDDTNLQKAQNKFYYGQSSSPGKYMYSQGYQKLDVAYARCLCLFGKPVENYSTTTWTGRSDIYDTFWNKWINERYNVQSKMITCYIDIKPMDFLKFRWNKFYKINNQLYHVNKIYDYDIMSNKPTKCDLIQVRDIEAYYYDDYQYIDSKFVNGNGNNDIVIGETRDMAIFTNPGGSWLIDSPGIFEIVILEGTGDAVVEVTCPEDATPGTYQISIKRTDSPFSETGEEERAVVEVTVMAE